MKPVKLIKEGLTVTALTEKDVGQFERAGFVKVLAPNAAPPQPPQPPDVPDRRKVSINKIYGLCEDAGVSPDDLVFEVENPTLAQVKAAIKAAKGGE